MGGLGNQLFQFAAGYAHSKKNDCHVEVDTSYFIREAGHGGYRLDRLELGQCVYNVKSSSLSTRLILRVIMRKPTLSLLTNGRIIHEALANNERITNTARISNATLLGYWQDSNLFSQYHEFLKSKVIPKEISKNAHLYQEMIMKSESSVSIHVRRGDYVNNVAAFKTHGVCSVSYYRNAISFIRNRLKDVHFFVFTNDPLWVEKELADLFIGVTITLVEGNSQEEDLWLMSRAKHHIIANSSFSWWGAWLAKHEMQIVIAPTPWYDKQPSYSTDPSLPEWNRLPK